MQLLAEPIEAAPQSLQDRISYLEGIIVQLKEENAAMAARQDHLIENQEIQLRLIRELKEKTRKEPNKISPTQENRAKILRALLASHNGKMLTKEARQIMRMDKGAFSRLVDAMPEYIETRPYSLDKRQTVLILKSHSIVDDNDQRSK